MRYTKEYLAPFVAKAKSYANLCYLLGLRPNGGSFSHLKRRVIALGLDVRHFTARGINVDLPHPGKMAPENILVKDRTQHRELASRLRRALIERGVRYVCEQCSGPPYWNNADLVLHVDHRDGDPLNNEESNLRFLCPNCHSQTPNFGARNIKPVEAA